MTATAHTHDEQLAAARLLLGLDAGADIVGPLKALLRENRELLMTLKQVKAILRDVVGVHRRQGTYAPKSQS